MQGIQGIGRGKEEEAKKRAGMNTDERGWEGKEEGEEGKKRRAGMNADGHGRERRVKRRPPERVS
jgi:hypothetical protein